MLIVTGLAEKSVDYDTREKFTAPEDVIALLSDLLDNRDREHCVVLSLNTKHRLLAADTVAIGTVANTFMGPREIFKTALTRGASAVILAHNHPSGDPEPSIDDRRVTRRLISAGEVLGVDVLDHIVYGSVTHWVSMKREGTL